MIDPGQGNRLGLEQRRGFLVDVLVGQTGRGAYALRPCLVF